MTFVKFNADFEDEDYTLTWDFDDGTSDATGSEVIHEFEDAGTYDVTLTVEGPAGVGTTSQSITVT